MLPSTQSSSNSTRILVSFICVYFFWGSTYLAIRYGLNELPPFVIASTRFLISGSILLAICAIRRVRMWPTLREFGLLAIIGVLMLGCGNSAVLWSELYLSTGLAALLVAGIPLFAALIEMFLPNGEGLPSRGWIGIIIGFLGLAFLVSPSLRNSFHGDSRQIIATVIILTGAFCWTAGSIISRRSTMAISGFAAAGWQMLFGGIFNTGIMFASGGYRGSHWDVEAWSSIFYLVIFGSLTGYTAYIYLLNHVAVSKVTTYAYVNPVIAVILGAIFIHERFVMVEYIGMASILLAVFLVTSSKLKTGALPAEVKDIAVGRKA
ncbi:EamA family transporter [Edaphobacter dinghuensis]|uniref:Drug/metabolite exporter YedA n=1 Tax=Edaphobacter dinghuensis TaxID=1560005 RepID=A0A917HSV2_9BACT|nr:EamA family transporter [Edaphobacter dinghuensis]GGG88265.1 drug/metabolite exporter YedA [Edaphobacter dinghuensis]